VESSSGALRLTILMILMNEIPDSRSFFLLYVVGEEGPSKILSRHRFTWERAKLDKLGGRSE
jgi:hypothetical protein